VNEKNRWDETCFDLVMQNNRFNAVEYLISLKPKISEQLSVDHPVVRLILNQKFGLAKAVLSLMGTLGTAGKDGYTIVHHFYQAYKCCKEADQLF